MNTIVHLWHFLFLFTIRKLFFLYPEFLSLRLGTEKFHSKRLQLVEKSPDSFVGR